MSVMALAEWTVAWQLSNEVVKTVLDIVVVMFWEGSVDASSAHDAPL